MQRPVEDIRRDQAGRQVPLPLNATNPIRPLEQLNGQKGVAHSGKKDREGEPVLPHFFPSGHRTNQRPSVVAALLAGRQEGQVRGLGGLESGINFYLHHGKRQCPSPV